MSAEDTKHGPGSGQERVTPYLDLSFSRTSRDMSTAALILAIVAVFLVAAVYLNSKSRSQDLADRVAQAEARVDERTAALEGRLAQFEKLPGEMRKQLVKEMTYELMRKATYLSGQVDDPEQKAKLEKIGGLLKEIDEGL